MAERQLVTYFRRLTGQGRFGRRPVVSRSAGRRFNGTKLRRALAAALPEWQIFVRRPDGHGEHFTFTRRKQLAALGGVLAVTLWAVVATLMLTHRPDVLASKERRLEAQMASFQAAQDRMASAQKMVGEIAHQIDAVHGDLTVLAQTNEALFHDRPAGGSVPLAKLHVGADPDYDDAALPGGAESKAVRDEVRKLEASLDRLRATYTQAVRVTDGLANERIGDAEQSLRRIGLDPAHLIAAAMKDKGRGGPFVPLGSQSSGEDGGLNTLVGRMETWDAVKMALQSVPLAEPLHVAWEVNSPFGARHDPLNNRTGIHEGVDMGAPYGTPVYATASGTVKMAGPFDRYGFTIDIDHGNGLMTRYAHLSRIKVTVGQKVTRSTVIGLLGASGRTTGPHLHYEVRSAETPRDPLRFISVGRDAAKIR